MPVEDTSLVTKEFCFRIHSTVDLCSGIFVYRRLISVCVHEGDVDLSKTSFFVTGGRTKLYFSDGYSRFTLSRKLL